MTSKIIAFFGFKGCGKSEAASQLSELYGFQMHTFATPLKNMLKALGLTHEQLYGDQKEIPSDLLGGKTPRWAMQSLGTEWGRKLIDPNLWLNAWQATLPAGPVVVEDLRFPNEAAAIKLAGGYIVKIERPGVAVATDHESERYVEGPDALPADEVIVNDGSLDSFKTRVALLQARVGLKGGS